MYILLLSGTILVAAAGVHFFLEREESDDPCENNKIEHNIGKIINTSLSLIFSAFLMKVYLIDDILNIFPIFYRLENIIRILCPCFNTFTGQHIFLLDVSKDDVKTTNV